MMFAFFGINLHAQTRAALLVHLFGTHLDYTVSRDKGKISSIPPQLKTKAETSSVPSTSLYDRLKGEARSSATGGMSGASRLSDVGLRPLYAHATEKKQVCKRSCRFASPEAAAERACSSRWLAIQIQGASFQQPALSASSTYQPFLSPAIAGSLDSVSAK